jgi:uncharacterized protein (TIGR02147 family)
MSSVSYRQILKDEFLARKENNRTYSIRAFAKHLELSPSFLSLVFRRKRHLSPEVATKVARKLNWSNQEQKYFLSLIEFENPKTEISRADAIERILKYKDAKVKFASIEADTFAAVSVWYHYAILSLLNTESEKHTTRNIARRFKLEKHEAETALHRLERLGLARLNGDTWSATHRHLQIKSIPSSAIRSYHKQGLGLAAAALDQQSFEERDFSTMTLTMDPAYIQIARSKIQEFQAQMAELVCHSDTKHVYQMSIQLFRLTQSDS